MKIVPVLIIGAGPAGLATAACLSRDGVSSLILEREDCIGSLWKYKTYDRLRLHLPKQFCHLPLLPMPAAFPQYPSRDEFLDYLEQYRAYFGIEPLCNTTVTSAEFSPREGLWRVVAERKTKKKWESFEEEDVDDSGDDYGSVDGSHDSDEDDDVTVTVVEYVARSLVVATGENADPYMPRLFGDEKFAGEVSHGMTYRNGAKYAKQKVLVVGAGNTGMEIALDLANFGARPSLAARSLVSSLHTRLNFKLTLTTNSDPSSLRSFRMLQKNQ